jgi:hypothetical protein
MGKPHERTRHATYHRPRDASNPVVSNYGLVLTVYILYLVGFLTGITVLLGVIIAYLQRDETDPICQSHFQFQITTFWIGLVYFLGGACNSPHRHRSLHLDVVGDLDTDSMRKRAPYFEQGNAIPDPNSWWFGE